MSNNEKLKAKLLKQKEKHSKRVSVVQKEKKKIEKKVISKPPKEKPEPKFFSKTQKHLEQRSKEEDYMRTALKIVLNDDYSSPLEQEEDNRFLKDILGKAYKLWEKSQKELQDEENLEENVLPQEWDEMSDTNKRIFVLEAIEKDIGALFGRQQFLNKFIHLSHDLQNDFIRKYISQPKNYTEYYEQWSQTKDISAKIQELKQEKETTIHTVDEALQIRLEIIQNLLNYAVKKGLDIEYKPRYSDMISQVTSDPKKQEKIYRKVAKNYIELARILGISNPENLSIGELSTSIIVAMKRYSEILNSKKIAEISRLPREELISRVTIMGIKEPEEKSNKILVYLAIINEAEDSKTGPKGLDEIFQEAEDLGIPYSREQSLENRIKVQNSILNEKERIERQRKRPKLISSKQLSIVEEIEDIQKKLELARKEAKPEPIEIEKLEQKLQTLREELDRIKHRDDLVMKLSKITGFPNSHYAGMSLEELQKRYQDMENGEEYWEDFQRETTIETLMDLTGKPMESFVGMTTEALLEELERAERMEYVRKELPGKVRKDSVYALKCLENFQQYKWISAKVTGVWLADPTQLEDNQELIPENIREYIYPNIKIFIHNKYFYQANKKFFNLQCNMNSKKRIQDNEILICYDNRQNPIRFIVGYTITGNKSQLATYKNKSVKLPSKDSTERFIVQDEEMFELEVQAIKKQNKTRDDQLNELLSQNVNPLAISIASRYLSTGLLSVAPKVEDYKKDSPYIQIAINSILIPGQTINALYKSVAWVLVFLNISQASTFKKRVEAEYYLPDTLMHLSPQDKFPEVFDSDSGASEKSIANMTSYLRSSVVHLTKEMADSQYQITNPTLSRTYKQMILPMSESIQYKDSVCVNKEDVKNVPRDNIVFYNDIEDEKTYCFDIEKIVENFNKLDFNNPLTGKKFSKEFIRRYTISYYDYITNKTFTFPFEKLYKQLKNGDTINKNTGTPFDPKFVHSIIKGLSFPKSLYERERKFRKLDYHTSKCQNPQDIADEPIESIIYYKDPETKKMYCFSIPKVAIMLEESGINPYTGKAFSKRFVRKFNSIFNLSLHDKGILQPEFRQKYGNKFIQEISEKIEPKEDIPLSTTDKLIIPKLWNIVNKELSKLEKSDSDTEDESEEDETTPNKDKETQKEDEEEDTEREEEEEDTEREEEEDEEDEDTEKEEEEEEESERDEEEDDDTEKEVEDVYDTEKEVKDVYNKKDDKVSKSETSEVKSEFEFDKKKEIYCSKCGKKAIFKSILFQNKNPKEVGFCCTDCAEKYNFPKYKGTGRTKKCKKSRRSKKSA